MYNNNSYTRPKIALEARNVRKSKAKGKSCGYYLRIIFFFSSLIQSLIIISLVLFLVYGQPEKTADEKRVEELEKSNNKLSGDKMKLMKEKADLTGLLKVKTTEKDAADKKLAKISAELDTAKENNSKLLLAISQCNASKLPPLRSASIPCPAVNPSQGQMKTLQMVLEQQKSLYAILQNNFTQTMLNVKFDMETMTREKNMHEAAVMKLKKEKEDLTSELQLYTKRCKEDFVTSLQGIQTVTSAFLTKIDNLFPESFTFLLTCAKQQEQIKSIHENCTNLSRQVENKFQNYLNNVGERVQAIQKQSSNLEVVNNRLTSEMQQCNEGRTQESERCARMLKEAQETQDQQVESLLKRQKQLIQEKQQLQTSCMGKPQPPRPSGLDFPMSFGQHTRTGLMYSGAPSALQSGPGSSQTP